MRKGRTIMYTKSNVNLTKRRLIQSYIDQCRRIIHDKESENDTIGLTEDDKICFYALAFTLKSLLYNHLERGKAVSSSQLANDFLGISPVTLQEVFFKFKHVSINKRNTLRIINKMEHVANDNFGTLEDMDDNDKIII